MTAPTQKPHRSEQSVQTPREFLDAVERRFGPIVLDLAADAHNRAAEMWFDERLDALSSDQRWTEGEAGVRWLNPPYSDIAPWAEKAAWQSTTTHPVLMLVPASVGSNWFAEHVHGKAMVLALSPRITFVGHRNAYPKDLILCWFGGFRGFDIWRWKP